jgi:hypothetical protein
VIEHQIAGVLEIIDAHFPQAHIGTSLQQFLKPPDVTRSAREKEAFAAFQRMCGNAMFKYWGVATVGWWFS